MNDSNNPPDKPVLNLTATGLAAAITSGNPVDSIFGSGGTGSASNSSLATLRVRGL
jgi:hypothetical protein